VTPSTYVEFHLLFTLPALVGLALVAGRDRRRVRRSTLLGVPLLAAIAVAYTTPWDNYLIARGVWWYDEGNVLATLWHVPLEEYLFFVVQTVIVGLWVDRLPSDTETAWPSWRARAVGTAGGLAVGTVGLAMLTTEPTFYLGAILAWSAPVLALQWGFGWPHLWRLRRTVALGTLVPTAYLAAADRVAIAAGVWTISDRFTTGMTVAGLPVEEGAFFLVTSLFVVQGLVLLEWVVDRWPR